MDCSFTGKPVQPDAAAPAATIPATPKSRLKIGAGASKRLGNVSSLPITSDTLSPTNSPGSADAGSLLLTTRRLAGPRYQPAPPSTLIPIWTLSAMVVNGAHL